MDDSCRSFRFLFVVSVLTCLTNSTAAASTNIPISEIRSILKDISASSSTLSQQQRSLTTCTGALNYSIFRGQSALRELPLKQREWIDRFGKSVAAILLLVLHESLSESSASSCSVLLLDAAHEVVLGVRPDNINEAEYAATRPGQTTWMQDHPLSDLDDWIHSIIHRREGHAIGEGNHAGWENAKYWAAGGPKQLYSSSTSSDDDAMNKENSAAAAAASCGINGIMERHLLIAQELARLARQRAPLCVKAGVVTTCTTQHYILAGGNGQQKKRIVSIPANCWDPFCFINLLSSVSCRLQQEREELDILLQAELDLLLKHAITNTTVIANQE